MIQTDPISPTLEQCHSIVKLPYTCISRIHSSFYLRILCILLPGPDFFPSCYWWTLLICVWHFGGISYISLQVLQEQLTLEKECQWFRKKLITNHWDEGLTTGLPTSWNSVHGQSIKEIILGEFVDVCCGGTLSLGGLPLGCRARRVHVLDRD